MYPVSVVEVGGIFIDNIEVFGTVSESDLGVLSVKIKTGETESVVEADCGNGSLFCRPGKTFAMFNIA